MYSVRFIRGPRSDIEFATFDAAWEYLARQVDGHDERFEAGQVWLDEGHGTLVVVATYDPANVCA